MRMRERVPCRATAGVLVVHFVRPSRGQISGVLLTQEMILGVLEASDVCYFAWYYCECTNASYKNTISGSTKRP